MDVVAIRGNILDFVSEWVSSSVVLIIEPSKFIPPAGSMVSGTAAGTSTTRQHVGFAASSVFIAILIFQLVARRASVGTTWDSVEESLPFSLLVVGGWVIWSVILALCLKALSGTRPPLTNIVFGLRALGTFYMLGVIVGAVAFLALHNRWVVFELAYQAVNFGLYAVYCPMIFGPANNLKGWKLFSLCLISVALSALRTIVGFGIMISNPGELPPASIA